jgi:hypothetical protein
VKGDVLIKTLGVSVLILAAAGSSFAQKWELGGSAGAGFLPGATVSSSFGAATAGFQSGAAVGGFVGQNLYRNISGEIHYNFLQSNLKLQSGGTTATFSGVAHVFHYDVVFHTNRKGRAQYFVAAGGGAKLYRGTGKEAAYQPLSQFGYFTHTQSFKPMASVGGGVKVAIAPRIFLRTEFRDYITLFPKEVLTPAPGAKFGSILHDFVPMVGISFEY